MNKMLLCIVIFIGISTCILKLMVFSHGSKETQYYKIIDRITDTYLTNYISPKQLSCAAMGGGMVEDIKKVGLVFNSCTSVNVEQARQLYIDIVEEYLRYVNEDEEVRPYLHNYPFTPANLYFRLGFRENNQSIKGEGHVASIVIARNIVYYDGYDTNSKKFYLLHKETYEEALSIVKKEQ